MGSPFYTRTRVFGDETGPPYEEAAVVNEYEAAHQEASNRVVAAERALDVRPTAVGFTRIVVLSQAEFDALGSQQSGVLYLVQPVGYVTTAADLEIWQAVESAQVTVQRADADTASTSEAEQSPPRLDADISADRKSVV